MCLSVFGKLVPTVAKNSRMFENVLQSIVAPEHPLLVENEAVLAGSSVAHHESTGEQQNQFEQLDQGQQTAADTQTKHSTNVS